MKKIASEEIKILSDTDNFDKVHCYYPVSIECHMNGNPA